MKDENKYCGHIERIRHFANIKEREALWEENPYIQLLLRLDSSALRIAAENLIGIDAEENER